MRKLIIIILALSVVLGIIFWKFSPLTPPKVEGPITLNFVGLWNDDTYIKDIINVYHQTNPNITINYSHQSLVNYRKRIQTQIQNSQAPDIILIHSSWLNPFLTLNSLASANPTIWNLSEYRATFYPVVSDSFTQGGQIYGVPVNLDGLVMYVNTDLLNNVGVSIPKDWFSFITASNKVTVRDTQGNITTSGAALGSTSNIEYWPDILGLLFSQQPGADINHPDNSAGAQVLKFYTSFITDPSHKTWDQSMEQDTQAFKEGKLAFYFAPISKYSEIKSANPNLHFQVTLVPQLPGNPTVNWGTFWAYGVSSSSQNPDEAWKFLKFLTQADSEKYIYQLEVKNLGLGDPSSRVDLSGEESTDPITGPIIQEAPTFKGGYLSFGTLDNGLDDEVISEYEGAVTQVLQGGDPLGVLQQTSKAVQASISKYTTLQTPSPSQ